MRVVIIGAARRWLPAVACAVFLCASPTMAQPAPAKPEAPPFAAQGDLRLSGSNTIGAELAGKLVTAYGRAGGLTAVRIDENADPDRHGYVITGAESSRKLTADISAHGTGTGFPDLAQGKADIAMASRPVNDAERALVKGAGLGDPATDDNAHVLSLDGVLILVNHDNPLKAITLEQAKALFTGAVTDWSAFGGKGAVSLYARDAASGTADTFRALVLGSEKIAPGAKLFSSSEDLADAVASDPGGIGFVGLAYARNAKALPIASNCGFNAAPRTFLIRTEEYPLSRRLFLYTGERPTPLAANFVRFALSDASWPIIRDAGFTSLAPELDDPEGARARIANLGLGLPPADRARIGREAATFSAAVSGAARLSITFRFRHDSADLDARALVDVDRLIAWAKDSGKRLILIGHASDLGDPDYNTALSRKRAAEIAARLRTAGLPVSSVFGVGYASLVACQDEQTRGGLNRRVEVWVK